MNILNYCSPKLWLSGLSSLRQWIDSIEIKNTRFAQAICNLIPPSCPFARRINVFGRTIFSIPPLCHFNPLYEELISLRFRALIFLSEQLPANSHQ